MKIFHQFVFVGDLINITRDSKKGFDPLVEKR